MLGWRPQQYQAYAGHHAGRRAAAARLRTNIDSEWRFQLGDVSGAQATSFDDSDWRVLNLPHDWTIEGEYSPDNPSGPSCGYLPAGIAWYRKTYTVPDAWRVQRRVTLEFDGVFRNSQVYVNGGLLGERAYGWISFAYDITEYVQQSGTIVIAVRVDNELQPAARWYTGSGIYSHVYILSTTQIHVDRYGTFVTTPQVTNEWATVVAETVVKNDSVQPTQVAVRSTIYSPDQTTPVAQQITPATTVVAGDKATVSQSMTVPYPELWSPDTPSLYRLQTEVLVGDQVADDYSTSFGIRTIAFSAGEGFFLNGNKLKLRGVADHWACGALGAAVPMNIMLERLQMLKSMGVNAVRTSHNPRPDYFYVACDQMGVLVMDEVFDGWYKKAEHDYGAHSFATDWRKDVTEWVMRDRNHPSIIIRSIGNETGTVDTNGIVPFIETMDTTRGSTGGAVTRGVSIAGVNGDSEVPGFQQPDKSIPFVATEAPHTWQVRGMYKSLTWYRDGYTEGKVVKTEDLTESEIFQYDWMKNPSRKRGFESSYDNAYVRCNSRYNWATTRDTDWRMGEFRWTGFDYIGEAEYVSGGFPYRLFPSGAIDSANFPKDLYYLYQSLWTDVPMVHILPSWTHPIMKEGTQIPVWVYSNCEVVELFQDGASLGKVTRGPVNQRDWPHFQFDWLVSWRPGTLVAVGYNAAGTQELTRETVTSAGAPAKISVSSPNQGHLPVDATHVEQVAIVTTDANGNFYPYGENRAYYHIDGPATLRAVDNGNPIDVEKHWSVNNRNAFMGLNRVYLQSTQEGGDVLFTAASILGEKRQLTSNLVSIDVKQVAMRGRPAVPEIAIYYTTDGSEPTQQSTRYTQPFAIPLETTVRAVVYANGQKILDMTEVFGANEGLYWDQGTTRAVQNVHRAVYPGAPVYAGGAFARGESSIEEMFAQWQSHRSEYVGYVVQNVTDVISSVGPRESGSQSERDGQYAVLSELSKYTDESRMETFEAHPHAHMGWTIISAFLLIGSVFLYNFDMRLWAFIASVAAFAVFVLEFVMNREFLDIFFPKRVSQNVIGTIRPRGPVTRRAVFSGHCDSSCEWWFNYLGGGNLLGAVAIIDIVGMVLFIALQIIFWTEFRNWLALFEMFYVPFYLLLLFFTNWNVVSPGANSSLAGVFCAVSVAKYLKENGIALENTEVQIVVTGCSESGLQGAKDYVSKHNDHIPTAFFCIDALRDVSDAAIYSRDQTGTVQNDLRVCEFMRRAGQLAGLDLEYRTFLFGATDAAAITQGGMPAATFAAMDPTPGSYYRTRLDDAGNMEAQAIGVGLDVAVGSLIVFDKEGF